MTEQQAPPSVYDIWKGNFEIAKNLKEGSKAILSDNSENRVVARKTLENILNSDSVGLIDVNSSTDVVLRSALLASQDYENRTIKTFKESSRDIVEKAYTSSRDGFAKNFAGINPSLKNGQGKEEHINLNDEEANKTVELHKTYYDLTEALKKINNGAERNIGEEIDLAQKVADTLVKDLTEEFISQGADKKIAKQRAAVIAELCAVSSPQKVYMVANITYARAKKRFESRFENDEQKSQYAKKLLDAKLNAGEQNYQMVSEELYRMVGK